MGRVINTKKYGRAQQDSKTDNKGVDWDQKKLEKMCPWLKTRDK